MTTPTEAQKTAAIKTSVMDLLDTGAFATRTERSVLAILYPMLTKSERQEVLETLTEQGCDRAETAELMNRFEEDNFGVRGDYK